MRIMLVPSITSPSKLASPLLTLACLVLLLPGNLFVAANNEASSKSNNEDEYNDRRRRLDDGLPPWDIPHGTRSEANSMSSESSYYDGPHIMKNDNDLSDMKTPNVMPQDPEVMYGPHVKKSADYGPSRGSDPWNNDQNRDSDNQQWEFISKATTPSSSSDSGGKYLGIADIGHQTIPFAIARSAPTDSFFIDSKGFVGIGTHRPQANLHLVTPAPIVAADMDRKQRDRTYPGDDNNAKPPMPTTIRLEDSNNPYNEQAWDISADGNGFYVFEDTGNYRHIPFQIQAGASSMSLVVDEKGNIGVGTDSPTQKLHVLGNAIIEDGSLEVNQCVLDTSSCSWKARRHRSLRHSSKQPEQEDSDEVHLESLNSQIVNLENELKMMESKMQKQEQDWMERFEALQQRIDASMVGAQV